MAGPAYYLRYNKSFNRMGGQMRYVTADTARAQSKTASNGARKTNAQADIGYARRNSMSSSSASVTFVSFDGEGTLL